MFLRLTDNKGAKQLINMDNVDLVKNTDVGDNCSSRIVFNSPLPNCRHFIKVRETMDEIELIIIERENKNGDEDVY